MAHRAQKSRSRRGNGMPTQNIVHGLMSPVLEMTPKTNPTKKVEQKQANIQFFFFACYCLLAYEKIMYIMTEPVWVAGNWKVFSPSILCFFLLLARLMFSEEVGYEMGLGLVLFGSVWFKQKNKYKKEKNEELYGHGLYDRNSIVGILSHSEG